MRNLARLLLSALFASSNLFAITLGDSKDDCKAIASTSARLRFRKYFKCDLSKRSGDIRAENKNVTDIEIFVRAELLNFDETENNLQFDGLLAAMWVDENLQWNSSLYDDIRSMPVPSYRIWTPDLAVLSAGYDSTFEHGFNYGPCSLFASGRVTCLSFVRRNIRCYTDFKLWPYDRQKCTLLITSWAYSSEQINLTIREDTLFMRMFRSNGEWNYSVSRVAYGERKSNYYENVSAPQIAVDFVLDRLHTHLRGRFIAPAIIMMVLTLTTLWLDPKSIERLAIASANIIVHIMSIQDLHSVLPHNGTTVPNLLIFYVNSFVFATVALLLTFFLGRMRDANKLPVPNWIASSTALVFRSKAARYFQLGLLDPKATAQIEIDADDTGELMSSEPKKIAWTSVVIVWSWISFICFFFAYIIMYGALIPSSAGKLPIPALHYYDRVDDQFGVDQ